MGSNRYQNLEIKGKLGWEGFLTRYVIFCYLITSLPQRPLGRKGAKKTNYSTFSLIPLIDLLFLTGYTQLKDRRQGTPKAFLRVLFLGQTVCWGRVQMDLGEGSGWQLKILKILPLSLLLKHDCHISFFYTYMFMSKIYLRVYCSKLIC